jgi:carbamoyltransferase
MLILGLNAYHGDSAACVVRDGQVVVAAEEERFRRVKHWAGLPTEAVKFCLAEVGAKLEEVDAIAINRDPKVNHGRRLAFILRNRPSLKLVVSKLRNIRKAASVEDSLEAAFPGEDIRGKVRHIEHHRAHLASAYLASEFNEAVCVSVDGFGDFASAAWGMGRGNDINIDDRVYFPHSLGIFYSALTQFLGFLHFGDEYKVMGLAPYGEPKFMTEMRELVRVRPDGKYELNLKYFRHHNENVSYTWNNCCPEVGLLYKPILEKLLGPGRAKVAQTSKSAVSQVSKPAPPSDEPLTQRHKDIARSIQAMYEEAFFALLNKLHDKYKCPNLALSGGCAMNSVANGKVYLKTPFRRMYLPAAAGDAGGAIGAALIVAQTSTSAVSQVSKPAPTTPSIRIPHSALRNGLLHAYLGPQFDTAYIHGLLKDRFGKSASCSSFASVQNPGSPPPAPGSKLQAPSNEFTIIHLPDPRDLCARTAHAISEGKVVGWFQGRMEWGPRALGNRSILGDPRRADMKDILNLKIKRRESFRPFAPSILRERVTDWFEQDDDVPFMMSVFQINAEKRPLIPAVTHLDGSGRLQTVHRETNPLYHQLITEFERLTNVPMVLNTSFNENEPVVCKPEEALDCFLRTKMDLLVLGEFLVTRN